MLTCRKLIKFLDDYVEGRLPEKDRKKFEKHLHLCPPCLEYLESYRKTIETTRDALTVDDCDCQEMPDELIKVIVQAATADKG